MCEIWYQVSSNCRLVHQNRIVEVQNNILKGAFKNRVLERAPNARCVHNLMCFIATSWASNFFIFLLVAQIWKIKASLFFRLRGLFPAAQKRWRSRPEEIIKQRADQRNDHDGRRPSPETTRLPAAGENRAAAPSVRNRTFRTKIKLQQFSKALFVVHHKITSINDENVGFLSFRCR